MNKPTLVYDVKQANNFREMLQNSVCEYGDNTAFLIKQSDGSLRDIKYREFFDEIKAFSGFLNSEKLENTKIAVIGKNCYEWALSYLAIGCGSGVIVPIDKELKPHDIKNILVMSEVSAIVYSDGLSESIAQIDLDIKKFNMANMPEMLSLGRKYEQENKSYERHTVNSRELGVLIYTSGTTGVAKGVMLSQYNICFNIAAVKKRVFVCEQDRVMSVLPLHHTYECTAGFLTMIYSGASITYLGSLRTIAADFALYKPTIFITVPLLLENIHQNIMKKFKKVKGGMAAYNFGIGVTRAAELVNINLKVKIFAQIHEFFGGRLDRILIGAAALSPKIFDDFCHFGFKLYNGYGLTETAPVCLMHDDFMKREANTVGYALTGSQAKLFEPNENGVGEVIFKGDNVMLGYYNNKEETEKVLIDGWFHTGDMAYIDENGMYHLEGRIKSMIVSPNGKKIFPEEMEALLLKKPYIKEVMVSGVETKAEYGNEVTVQAKIFPDFEAANEVLQKSAVTPDSEDYDERLKELIVKQVKEVNRSLPNYKSIKSVQIRKTEFEKTTTRKIKRFSAENN